MSFLRKGSFILYVIRRLGAHATVSLALLLGFCVSTKNTLAAQEYAIQFKSNVPSSLKVLNDKVSYPQESFNLLLSLTLRGCVDPITYNLFSFEMDEIYRQRLLIGMNCASIPNRDGFYFLSHSGHKYESIFHLTPTTDQQRRHYLNNGCVSDAFIHFYTIKKDSLQSMDYYDHNMKSDTNEKPFSHLSEHLNFQ